MNLTYFKVVLIVSDVIRLFVFICDLYFLFCELPVVHFSFGLLLLIDT